MDPSAILTPDQRVRVFVSSTLGELAEERKAVRTAIDQLHLTPVMFESGARPYPPRSLYLAYLRQSHVFVGIYGERYGWVAPDMDISGLEDELQHAGDLPKLLYVKRPGAGREPRLTAMIEGLQQDAGTSYKSFSSAEELGSLLAEDLAVLLTERFAATGPVEGEVTGPEGGGVRVPRPASEFVGRWHELAELADLVTSEGVRLVTLTGPGGIGKTRLAIQVAETVADKFPDGVVFVPLAARRPDDFLEALATEIGLRDLGQAPLPQLLVERLRKLRLLLVLDNFEQLVPAAGELARLMEHTASVRILVTSRTALRLTGEEEFPVPPLGLPRVTSRVEEVGRAEAVQLFCRRVAAVRHGYRLTEHDAVAVARICHRLDGLPLALELVAARANVLSIDELATRLDKVLDLSARAADVPARQRTLRQTMDWSYAQLPAGAGEVFARLGVFVGSFSLRAAEAVCEVGEGVDLLDTLAVLVDHSLVRPQLDAGTTRFSMLEIVREYARSRLDDASHDTACERHAAYYRGVAAAAPTGLRGPGQRAMIARLDRNAADLAAALDWLLAQGRRVEVADMCWSLWLYHWLRNSLTEGRRWTRAALTTDGTLPPIQRGRLLAGDGFLAGWRREYALADQELTEAVAIAEREQDDELRLLASIMLIVVAAGLGDEPRARRFGADALRLAGERHDRWAAAIALTGLCWLNAAVDRFADEEATFEDMMAAARWSQDPLWVSLALDNMAELRMWQRRYSEAASMIIESLTMLAELGMAYAGVGSLHSGAWLLSRVHDWSGAVRVQSAGDAVMAAMKAGLWPPLVPRRDRLLQDARTNLGKAAFDVARAEGLELTFEEAVVDAVHALRPALDEPAAGGAGQVSVPRQAQPLDPDQLAAADDDHLDQPAPVVVEPGDRDDPPLP